MAQGEQRALDKTGRVFPLKEPNQHVMVIYQPKCMTPPSKACVTPAFPDALS